MVKKEFWTLVRHSAVRTGHAEFSHAIEERSIAKAVVDSVIRAGGVVLEDYMEACELVEKLNYPPGNDRLIPTFRGTFAELRLNGDPVAIPRREVVA